MFTGFSTENTPAIQIWDFFIIQTSSRANIGLTDDCAPIQLFRTGWTTLNIFVFLPTCPIEGKIIKIVNQKWGGSSQVLNIYSSDRTSSTAIAVLGPGGSVDLVYSKILGGGGASATPTYTGGWSALNFSGGNASNAYGVALGDGSRSTGVRSFACGQSATASATESIALGSNHTASSSNAAAFGGYLSTANGVVSTVLGGYLGNARSIAGNMVFPASASPITFVSGTTQTGLLILGRETTNATATRLTSNTSVAGTDNQLILPNNSAYYFRGSVICAVTGGGNTKSWAFEGAIKRGANAASTTIVQSVVNVVASNTGAETWLLDISADTTNGGLAVTATGAAATTIRWVCKLESTEVTF